MKIMRHAYQITFQTVPSQTVGAGPSRLADPLPSQTTGAGPIRLPFPFLSQTPGAGPQDYMILYPLKLLEQVHQDCLILLLKLLEQAHQGYPFLFFSDSWGRPIKVAYFSYPPITGDCTYSI
ncbi:hypothetical protein BDZ94DRAFT_1251758 [Collybia nuda]|uniref:Uncharacterized protein n=1 Tax=Collybia nuda TaxID=64659 RepID=A0A9P6CHL9_9AGAR|nr:hypothetical protein BDZ94DRAFT_1251758 [Collybia nuda]